MTLQAWHSRHPLASPESRRASVSGKAFQPRVSRQSSISPGTGLGSQDFARKAPVSWGPNWPWRATGTWESIWAREACRTFGSSGPHKPWGSWESFTTRISWETFQSWCPIGSWESWCPSEAFGTSGARASWLAWQSLGPSNTTWLDDVLPVTSNGPFHTCITIYLSWSAGGAGRARETWWSR